MPVLKSRQSSSSTEAARSGSRHLLNALYEVPHPFGRLLADSGPGNERRKRSSQHDAFIHAGFNDRAIACRATHEGPQGFSLELAREIQSGRVTSPKAFFIKPVSEVGEVPGTPFTNPAPANAAVPI